MNKNVIYTAIFGDYDHLEKPKFIPDNLLNSKHLTQQ